MDENSASLELKLSQQEKLNLLKKLFDDCEVIYDIKEFRFNQKKFSSTEIVEVIKKNDRGIIYFEYEELLFEFSFAQDFIILSTDYLYFQVKSFTENKLSIWQTFYKYGDEPDDIRLFRFMLDISEDFIITYFNLQTFDTTLWDVLNCDNNYNNWLHLLEEKGSICAIVGLSNKTENALSDSLDIKKIIEENNYILLSDFKDQKILKNDEISSQLESLLLHKKPDGVYLQVEGYDILIKFENGLVSITPQEPFKIKTMGELRGIDLAFYLNILLTLFDPFGISEMRCNIEQKIS